MANPEFFSSVRAETLRQAAHVAPKLIEWGNRTRVQFGREFNLLAEAARAGNTTSTISQDETFTFTLNPGIGLQSDEVAIGYIGRKRAEHPIDINILYAHDSEKPLTTPVGVSFAWENANSQYREFDAQFTSGPKPLLQGLMLDFRNGNVIPYYPPIDRMVLTLQYDASGNLENWISQTRLLNNRAELVHENGRISYGIGEQVSQEPNGTYVIRVGNYLVDVNNLNPSGAIHPIRHAQFDLQSA